MAVSQQPQHFLFGPQFLSFTSASLSQLRTQCLGSPGLHEWVLQVLAELPALWKTIKQSFPSLAHLPVEKPLQDVLEAFRTGDSAKLSFPLPNFLLCPFVVILQLTQFVRYHQLVQPRNGFLFADADAETQLEQHGASAVRLALLIGAIVESHNASDAYISISTGWQSPEGAKELASILEAFPEAYISVTYDENRRTVTAPKHASSALVQRLKDAGLQVTELSLQGRFHDPRRSTEIGAVIEFCDTHQAFSLPDAHSLVLPTRSQDGSYITKGNLHEIALRAILVDHCQWHQTFASISLHLANEGSIISFGLERCVPQSLLRHTSHKLIQMTDVDSGKSKLKPRDTPLEDPNHDAIAVIGMSCRVPGADDVEEFWKLLCENKSQHREVPSDRFNFDTAWRNVDPKRKWFGNFIDGFNNFDHKFFNKTPREALAMDPQQKMMLQAAYQAVEQSGYFQASRKVDKHIGCYIGVSNVDYQDNSACHAATAYTATGTLMSFVAGKIGHFFGWTGPAMSIDTACSGSSVAVHEACRAVLSGECTAAIAGGVNAITGPLWFQNLAGASFLSTTGQCKPFDAKGDGYCRGEAAGAVMLKRLSSAIADGDPIFGTIAATAVFQNQNCTAITVPNSPSLSSLFEAVISRARIDPYAITYVEAHGTGTAVGDPAEYGGILKALGGPKRSSTLALRSVKGLVGHAECASGMVALVKTLLQLQKGIIAPQASHQSMNPALHASPSDHIEISTQAKKWDTSFKAALINNYGASGSNASMVVTEAPSRGIPTALEAVGSPQQPFWFCGANDERLRAYVSRFLAHLDSSAEDVSLADLSFNLALQSNRNLGRALVFQSSSIKELKNILKTFQQNEAAPTIEVADSSRPVILCFGGQVSTFVGLDRQILERITILRKYMDQCDLVCKAMGLTGIYPDIFKREPIQDTVQLQTCLFAMQYSCAKSWIDCGLRVTAVVGHSFGELVAQTVAGAMSLNDGLKVIARRAQLIRDSWESDRGAMLAIEAEIGLVQDLIARANKTEPVPDRPAGIACFNGPTSFTLAGSTQSIQNLESILTKDKSFGPSIRYRKLNTSHAFHSTLVECLIPDLEQLTHDITFSTPHIRVERATERASTASLPSSYIAEHLRQPVYFSQAVRRLADEHEDPIWIEAGSQSTITKMAAKALGMPKKSHFQAMNLTSDDSWQRLTEAFTALWTQGLKVDFWPHHPSQTSQYIPLLLPPYQFEKCNHFLDLKVQKSISGSLPEPASNDAPRGLWTFVTYENDSKTAARFLVETGHKIFQELMAGHTVAHSQPLCPSTLQLDIATEAIRSLCPELQLSDFQIDLRNLENQSPICRDSSRVVWLDVTATDETRRVWAWKMVSTPVEGKSGVGESRHASGKVVFRSRDEREFLEEFERFGRLVTHKRCSEALAGSDGDDIIQGEAIYKLFADVVDYSEIFRGVRKVVGSPNTYTSAGRVVKKYSDETWLDTPLCDSFCQVAGVFVNCMTQRPDSDAFISSGVQRIVRSPFIRKFEENPEVFDVFALHHKPTEKSFSSDVFIFDNRTSQLLGVILGIQYQRVSKVAMAKLLARLTPDAEQPRQATKTPVSAAKTIAAPTTTPEPELKPVQSQPGTPSGDSMVAGKIIAILSEMTGVEAGKITGETNLIDLGIDSLMGMEVARELESVFQCTLDMSSMMDLTILKDLVNWVRRAVGEADDKILGGSDTSAPGTATPDENSSSPEIMTPLDSDVPFASLEAKVDARQAAIDLYIAKYSRDFSMASSLSSSFAKVPPTTHCVLVSGATGSLGAHLAEHFAKLPSVGKVVCFNRPSRGTDPMTRQLQSFEEKGISLTTDAIAKLKVIAADTSKPFLGLEHTAYTDLVNGVTHIVHCAWPMSITRTVAEFEDQFVAMRNLIDLSRDASNKLPHDTKIGFQFISSIATVGMYPVVTGNSLASENPSMAKYALPSGYSDAKLVCEGLVAETLGRYPDHANAMAVRVGQVAGSSISGYWNPMEHFSLLVKSAQTLNALPALPGHLSWLPVNDVAASLADLLLSDSPATNIYHVENPVRQPWSEVTSLLADELAIPSSNIIPYDEWLKLIRDFPRHRDAENPAKRVITFLENDFIRMATGGLILGVDKATKVSKTLRNAVLVERGLIKSYIRSWRDRGVL
ncbi:hypothetical protein S40293_07064 [Stachybotrys chartarum IBT 40293]|nr:hypothetical protein S40293_07064 [Stachybotrys chartarum IBT 40293]